MKKIPLRTCVISKEKLEKKDLLRVVRTPDNQVLFDETGKVNGKGIYLKKSPDIVLKAQKSDILSKLLEVKVPESVYNELLERSKN